MAYKINDRCLIDEIKDKYVKYIGTKSENPSDKYTGIMKTVYDNTFEIAKQMNEAMNEADFKITFDKLEHPLDEKIIGQLTNIIGENEEILYSKAKELDKLWCDLLRKSINCLRYFDTREPFMFDKSKRAVAYGIDQLERYHDKYTKFESLLYGASEYYRDHVFHSIRTWLVGVFCLLHEESNGKTRFIDMIQIDGVAENELFASKINFFEKLSMWTISALCHDLGYPLEKSQQILDKTKNMMKEFVSNPTVFSNFGFNGIQDNINEYIVKFMSTKMKALEKNESEITELYHGRIQPKYYLKYTKSLEKNKHGIISAVIIYKMLLYFLESDFNLNDDHIYKAEDARQFYIRREILRSISSHTCSDIYNIKNNTFSSLLYICDEMQEWGRKSWNDLYTNINPNSITLSIKKFNSELIEYSEEIRIDTIKEDELIVENIERIYTRQFEAYQLIFRDGQYTNSRTFNLKKEIKIIAATNGAEENNFIIKYDLLAKDANAFSIDITNSKIEKDTFKKLLENKLKIKELPEIINIKG